MMNSSMCIHNGIQSALQHSPISLLLHQDPKNRIQGISTTNNPKSAISRIFLCAYLTIWTLYYLLFLTSFLPPTEMPILINETDNEIMHYSLYGLCMWLYGSVSFLLTTHCMGVQVTCKERQKFLHPTWSHMVVALETYSRLFYHNIHLSISK